MPMILTQVYLEPEQKKALTQKARKTGRKASDLVREAVDGLLLGVNPDELRQLDEATRRAEKDLLATVECLDANALEHRAFVAAMGKLRAAP
jgi:predicted DNA-binding protein